MGNECCTVRSLPRLNLQDLPDGKLLKEAILTRNAREVENLVTLTTDRRVLNCIADENKNSPFLLVCEHFPTDTNLIDVVAARGAQTDLRNSYGESAIHILAKGGSPKDTALNSIKHLNKKYKVPLHFKDLNGYDALWNAVRCGDICAYKYLKSWGCDRHYVDSSRENLLFIAVKLKSLPLVKQMVEYDLLDIHLVNKKGKSLLDVAAESCEEIYAYLKGKGVERNAVEIA